MLGTTSLRRATHAASLLLVTACSLAWAGCVDRTSILITVSSEDYVVPEDIDRMTISVRGLTTGMSVDREFPLSAPWPHSLAVRPGMVESSLVRITVTAYHGETYVTRRVLERSFTPGFEEGVEVVLQGSCRNVICGDNNDCTNGNCVGEMRDAGPLPDAGLDAAIDGGIDTNSDAPCPAGFSNCGGRCINPLEHPIFCGADPACEGYSPCVGNESCIDGVCSLYCDPGSVNCDGFCVNPQTDRNHCGASLDDCAARPGMTCPAGEYCALGACNASCPPGFYLCFGNCIDPTSDRQYCGAAPDCSGGRACFAGESCASGVCVTACPGGQVACGGRCVDPMSDRVYCGASATCEGGTSCAAGEVCVNGACGASCPGGQIECGGRCIDPQTEEGFCGARPDCTGGSVCVSGFICRDGACVANCPAGQVGCGGRCVDPLTDEANCGADMTCNGGVVCGARQNCVMGVCGCQAPERDCGMGCVDTRFDPTNCSSCGNACDPGQVCSGAACMALSGSGFTGTYSTTWTQIAFPEVACIQEYTPNTQTYFYYGGGPNFGAFDLSALTFAGDTAPPFTIMPNCSFAYLVGGIFLLTSTDATYFQPPTHEWRTVPLGMDLGTIGMSVTDGDTVWTANSSFLVRGNIALSSVEPISAGTMLTGARLTYDNRVDRLFFASQGSAELRSYDPASRTLRLEGSAPGPIGAAFCSDREGHLYIGSQANPRLIWQYGTASGRWEELPLLPSTPALTGTTNCGVAEAGFLFVAASPGSQLYRLGLDRL